jgi:predicted  nucleic acid-binding Zn ribbon protein
MSDRNTDTFLVVPVSVLILIAIFVIFYYISGNIEKNKWNNGYCECGGTWQYQQAIGHQSYTKFLYKCDNCGKMREFSEYREIDE